VKDNIRSAAGVEVGKSSAGASQQASPRLGKSSVGDCGTFIGGDCDFLQLMNEYGEHVETSERDWCFFEAYETFRIAYPASAAHTERDQTKRYQPSASASRGLQAHRKPN
jgi:hypothetical protein